MTEEQEFMSEEAFDELIDNLEIVEKLTLYGRKNIKYYFKKLQEEKEKYKYLYQKALDNTIISDRENIRLKKQIDLMSEYMEENMDEYQLDEIYAKQYNCNGMERNWTRGKEKEVTDIKQYFKKLAEEKGETRCI